MASLSNLPYSVEYAKSGRASCRGCKGSIEKESLRIAIMVQSRHHDGRDSTWYHPECFFEKKKSGLTVGDFFNFDNIRWNDQQFLTKKIGGGGNSTSASAGAGSTKKMIGEFSCEYAKSNRSTCAGCDEPIEKGIVRISKLDHESESALLLSRAIPRWYHTPCFTKLAPQLDFFEKPDKITGFKSLEKPDQQALLFTFKNSLNGNKRKLSEDVAGPSKPAKAIKPEPETVDRAKLKMQMETMYKLRDRLSKSFHDGTLKVKELAEFMRFNKQEVPVPCGEQVLLDQAADMMIFGRLDRCSVCKHGQYVYVGAGVGYRCNGDISEFTKCMHVTKNPLRKKIGIPKNMVDYMNGIKYKFDKVQERIIPPPNQPSSAARSSNLFPKLNLKPLNGFQFVLSGHEAKKEITLKNQILQFGGKIQTNVTKHTTAVVGKAGANGDKGLQDLAAEKKAVNSGTPVVSTQFVDGLTEMADVVELMKKSLLGTHYDPADLQSRLQKSSKSEKKSTVERRFETKEKKAIVQLKGGFVVDDDCEVARETHVYKSTSGLMYSVVLNNSNVDTGKNSYYKMQLLERDQGKGYYVFRSYGRIGTIIGKKITSDLMDLEEALEVFNNAFTLQTGNIFGRPFVKKPNMYMLLDVHYADEPEVQSAAIKTAKNSKLQLAVQELICLIFDVEKMKQTMMEFELDLEKLPLGKISRKQIMVAYGILNDTLKILQKPETAAFERQLVDVTNRFFTLIPHNFGLSQPPVLKEEAMIKDKILMLENLLEIELAYELLREGDSKEGLPVDTHYATLKAKIEPLEKQSSEFEIIQKYLKNTHAETHKEFELEIHDVFTVQRNGESTRYQEFQKLHNKMLLWHGSRTTNFVGILSQGLRIAPPEAPVTGYMFGKGIYFADMVSKSANYCNTKNGGTGLLLLCEVALGDMQELTSEKSNLLKAPRGKHSVKGIGQTTPDPKGFHQLENGVVVPYGKPVKTDTISSLLYNEYIVYNTAQVNIRYLVRVKFSAPKSRR